jgi:pimeloyl-ACP methyl ester carboxylesterase
MADSDPTTHMLDVPGARLYYERRGSGPLLLMIGSPMDSTGFAPLASALADRYTVVTYDPRGIGNSSREDASDDVTPTQQADDVQRLLSALGGGPADVFGSSGGAVVGLALVTTHPDRVQTLVAHEPPVVELLADAAQRRAEIDDVYEGVRDVGSQWILSCLPSMLVGRSRTPAGMWSTVVGVTRSRSRYGVGASRARVRGSSLRCRGRLRVGHVG